MPYLPKHRLIADSGPWLKCIVHKPARPARPGKFRFAMARTRGRRYNLWREHGWGPPEEADAANQSTVKIILPCRSNDNGARSLD
jgi:hypothetical protein